VELGLVRRDIPFGESLKDTKRTAYRLADPFLRFWFRFVEPNRSRLEAGLASTVASDVEAALPQFVSAVWEDLVRESVPRAGYLGRSWSPAAAWWGPGTNRAPLEIDIVAESDGDLLVGEVKWQEAPDWPREAAELRRKAENLPLARGKRVRLALWAKKAPQRKIPGVSCYTPKHVLAALR
jgi:hypothetical protein